MLRNVPTRATFIWKLLTAEKKFQINRKLKIFSAVLSSPPVDVPENLLGMQKLLKALVQTTLRAVPKANITEIKLIMNCFFGERIGASKISYHLGFGFI